jgi:hypothetical protein
MEVVRTVIGLTVGEDGWGRVEFRGGDRLTLRNEDVLLLWLCQAVRVEVGAIRETEVEVEGTRWLVPIGAEGDGVGIR